MDILKFSVIGHVDDGKSTLIGRLLYDSKSLMDDQLQTLQELSQKRGEEFVNLALLTDGLRAEREQGITIDVAYRYFATSKRKFIIADCPGHIQYTRNMVTGTSNADLCVLLIDARNGIVEQTKRHTFIASLMHIKHLVLCVNKMDLVEFSNGRFEEIRKDFVEFTRKLNIPNIHIIPIAALQGDNVVTKSQNMPWYEGASLLYTLENVYASSDVNHVDCRFPIQKVIRPQTTELHDFRGYAGRIESGIFKPGDTVTLLPSGFKTKIKQISTFDNPDIKEAHYPMSVVMQVEDDLDISRGDMMVKQDNLPVVSQDLDILVCWLSSQPADLKRKYLIKHTTNTSRCLMTEVKYKINVNTLHRYPDDKAITMNDIGRVTLRLSRPLFFDSYGRNKKTGSIILIDEQTNQTVAAGMIR